MVGVGDRVGAGVELGIDAGVEVGGITGGEVGAFAIVGQGLSGVLPLLVP